MSGAGQKKVGYTLIEMLVVVAIIGVLATVIVVAVGMTQKKARDAKRKFELAQIGRFLASSACYMPAAGPGEHELAEIFKEVAAKNPQITKMISRPPRDPRGGTDEETGYRYIVSDDGQRCALYGNLENKDEKVTISGISAPTPGGGTGVLQSASTGRNGTNIFFQVSN